MVGCGWGCAPGGGGGGKKIAIHTNASRTLRWWALRVVAQLVRVRTNLDKVAQQGHQWRQRERHGETRDVAKLDHCDHQGGMEQHTERGECDQEGTTVAIATQHTTKAKPSHGTPCILAAPLDVRISV